MEDTHVAESGGIEDNQSASSKSTSFSVQLGKLTPPKMRSAKIRGKGSITFTGSKLGIYGRIYANQGLVILFTLPATIVTAVITWAGILALVLLFSIWYFIFQAIIKREVSLKIDSSDKKAYYMRKRSIACIELPDGRWIAIRCLDGDDATLLSCLQETYGDRLALGE